MATALIRQVPKCFDRALVREGRPAIDVELARRQHDEYRRRLEEAGYTIEVVPPDESHPDCVFVEDTAVIVGSVALITRPGAPERRGETEPVAAALSGFPLVRVNAPATIDGGDVLTAGDTLYVGRSSRTNDGGIGQLRAVASDQGFGVIVVDVHDTLHLKSAVLPVDAETVVVTRGAVDEEKLADFRIVYESDSEPHRFSALPLRDGTVLVTASAPATAARVVALGHRVVPIDVSQIQAADGGLTCMAVLF